MDYDIRKIIDSIWNEVSSSWKDNFSKEYNDNCICVLKNYVKGIEETNLEIESLCNITLNKLQYKY